MSGDVVEGPSTQYVAQVYKVKQGEDWKVHFVITKDVDLHFFAAVWQSIGAIEDNSFSIAFDSDRICMDIPSDGLALESGWKITPLSSCVIQKGDVDNFTPGTAIPECVFNCRWTKTDQPPVDLVNKAPLLGARDQDYFMLNINVIAKLQGLDKEDTQAPLNEDDHFVAVRTVLRNLRPQWRNIGLELGIPLWKLKEFTGTDGEKMDQVVAAWLACFVSTPTWGSLIAALKDPIVEGGKPVAAEIAAKMCVQEFVSQDDISQLPQVPLTTSDAPLNADDHFNAVHKVLRKLKTQWHNIGRALGFTLRELKAFTGNDGDKMDQVVEQWLNYRYSTPILASLITALKDPMVEGGILVADEITERMCVQEPVSQGEVSQMTSVPLTNADAPLNEDDHYVAVRTTLLKIRPQWRNIGLALGIPLWKLKQFTGTYGNKMDQVVESWLSYCFSTPTWGSLIAALKDPIVEGGEPVAAEIAAKMCVQELVSQDDVSQVPSVPTNPDAPLNEVDHYLAVRRVLLKLESQWHNVGQALDIPLWNLQQIFGTDGEKMDQVVETWLSYFFSTPTWGSLIAALKDPIVEGGKPVAAEIAIMIGA